MTVMRTYTIIPLYGFCICMDSAFMGRSSPTTAFDGAIWYFVIPLYGFCICMDSAFMGRSSPTTAFDGAIWYFADTM